MYTVGVRYQDYAIRPINIFHYQIALQQAASNYVPPLERISGHSNTYNPPRSSCRPHHSISHSSIRLIFFLNLDLRDHPRNHLSATSPSAKTDTPQRNLRQTSPCNHLSNLRIIRIFKLRAYIRAYIRAFTPRAFTPRAFTPRAFTPSLEHSFRPLSLAPT
ncbi:hypothetical protein K505DRAFT_32164 [Melanomma pulvis-pyrius CBS 109.77]|uniref:Uncharacterized protein n=1 Tax=Melanomma pulvis-pyrius CBS 109.77 TaxID=1314802 RepID=A0A6A6XWN9_9PLEO|nr:hypothetical protein K505DRAFT_32164 [Melanomma pulvis-pyrius CBS 109.77]